MSTIAAKLGKLKNANYRETELLTLPDGTLIILSTLTGAEDLEMASYLTEFVTGAFGHHTKLETLAHSVAWLQGPEGEPIDLRGLTHIPTGGMLSDGSTPIKKRKHVFMRDIVRSWPDVVLDALFTRYAMLMEDLEKDIGKGIKVELGPDATKVKIFSLAEELDQVIGEARKAGLDLPEDMLDFRKGEFKKDGADVLLSALEAQQTASPPPVPEGDPIDEQLDRERAENPDVYPIPEQGGVIEETPQRVRK